MCQNCATYCPILNSLYITSEFNLQVVSEKNELQYVDDNPVCVTKDEKSKINISIIDVDEVDMRI